MQNQYVMKVKILKTEKEYNIASDRIYKLINDNENPIEPGSTEGDEIELLSLLIEKYEHEHFPIDAPNPIEAIKFRMEQMNLKKMDVAPLFGGKTRVSEVLGGKRSLTLKMITLLNRYLGIPLESLVIGNRNVILKPDLREKLLSISSVKEYFNNTERTVITQH